MAAIANLCRRNSPSFVIEIKFKTMKELKTEIKIAATREEVWRILMDFGQYPSWNPFLIRIEGEAKVGSYLSNTIQMEGNKTMEFKPEVLKVDKNTEFRWKGKVFVKGLFDGEHYFQLQDDGDGFTTLTHGEQFTGVLASAVFKMIGKDTLAGFEKMNKALKRRAEAKGEEVRHAG